MAASATYIPTIVEASPRSDRQREAAAHGVRGWRVAASGKTRINNLKVVAYLVWMTPDGGLRCSCHHSKYSHKPCVHKQAVSQHLAQQPLRLTCSSCGKQVPDRGQLREGGYVCEACKRGAAILQSNEPEGFSIYIQTPRERAYAATHH